MDIPTEYYYLYSYIFYNALIIVGSLFSLKYKITIGIKLYTCVILI